MRRIVTAIAIAGTLMLPASSALADVSATQTLPAAACNAGTMNAHESVPETTGNGTGIHAHEAIPGTENVTPCGHGG